MVKEAVYTYNRKRLNMDFDDKIPTQKSAA